jgi:hypothetical protein
MARRKGGRTKKVIDYSESSPLPSARNNKGTEKTVTFKHNLSIGKEMFQYCTIMYT